MKTIRTYLILAGFLVIASLAWFLSSDIASSNTTSVTVSATVGSSITCSTDNTATAFSALTSSVVATSSLNASTTMSCNIGVGCTLQVYDAGNGSNGGLATTSPAYLIPSPNAAFSTTAGLVANTEGYGIQATTTLTGSGGTLGMNSIYNSYNTNTVGKLSTSTTAQTLVSSTIAISNREVVVKHKAAISGTTQAGSYVDTITYSCVTN